MIVVGIDAGGTTWKAIATSGPGDIRARTSIPTTSPDETTNAMGAWIEGLHEDGMKIAAIGLATFGPVDRDPTSSSFGELGKTPKADWRGANPRALLEKATGLACALDTDVNGALLAELKWGAGKGLSDVAYVTVGTGIGGAASVGGNLVGAPYHGEFGHIKPARDPAEVSSFSGACAYHGDCLEGLASATAIKARWGADPHDLPDGHEAWAIVANYLAQLCASMTYLLAPQRIILGGGVMQRPHLIGLVRETSAKQMNAYDVRPEARDLDSYITLPGLGADAGAFGGALLAIDAMQRKGKS